MIKSLFLLSIMGLASSSFAAKSACNNVSNCIKHVSKITGVKYYSADKLKGSIYKSSNFKVTKKNADAFISDVLNQNGYTRIETDEKTFKIIDTRDIRYNPVPMVQADKKNSPNLPNNHDYYMMKYTLENPIVGRSVTRSLRPFMSRYGRIIHGSLSGIVIIQDTAINLKRVYKLINNFDVKPSEDAIDRMEEYAKKKHQVDLVEKKCKHGKR